MFADASGDSAVIEWVDVGVKVLRREGPVHFMTNHLLSKPETAGGPSPRYAEEIEIGDLAHAPAVPKQRPWRAG